VSLKKNINWVSVVGFFFSDINGINWYIFLSTLGTTGSSCLR
jgi:hypothetical protein